MENHKQLRQQLIQTGKIFAVLFSLQFLLFSLLVGFNTPSIYTAVTTWMYTYEGKQVQLPAGLTINTAPPEMLGMYRAIFPKMFFGAIFLLIITFITIYMYKALSWSYATQQKFQIKSFWKFFFYDIAWFVVALVELAFFFILVGVTYVIKLIPSLEIISYILSTTVGLIGVLLIVHTYYLFQMHVVLKHPFTHLLQFLKDHTQKEFLHWSVPTVLAIYSLLHRIVSQEPVNHLLVNHFVQIISLLIGLALAIWATTTRLRQSYFYVLSSYFFLGIATIYLQVKFPSVSIIIGFVLVSLYATILHVRYAQLIHK